LIYLAVNVGSVPYRVCVLEITLGLWDRQIEVKGICKMQTHKKSIIQKHKHMHFSVNTVLV